MYKKSNSKNKNIIVAVGAIAGAAAIATIASKMIKGRHECNRRNFKF